MYISSLHQTTTRCMVSMWRPLLPQLSKGISHMTAKNLPKEQSFIVNRILKCTNCNLWQKRSFTESERSLKFHSEKLETRSLVKLTGHDTFAFLQGLVTNDVRRLEKESSIYCMILNSQGRVLYDILVYKIKSDEPTVLLECNSDVSADLISTLQKYKLRKKVKLSDVGDELYVSSIFNQDSDLPLSDLPPLKFRDETKVFFHDRDPRIKEFAYRIVTPTSINVAEVVEDCEQTKGSYNIIRYKIGLSEGTVDLPPTQCLPLESNLVFLNGVVFDKGCYVGQELTARTHHTGVIRKRLMPLVLSSELTEIKPDATVENSSGKACGKIRNVVGKYGLALLRLEEVIGKPELVIKDGDKQIAKANTCIPSWWNIESDAILTKITPKKQSN